MKMKLVLLAIITCVVASLSDYLVSASSKLTLSIMGKSNCSDWMSVLRLVYITELPPCPCTYSQAINDDKFILSNFLIDYYHNGAANCFRAPSQTSLSESGQQCCYGDDGNILIGIEQNGGTADAYSPDGVKNFGRHIWYDVLPWVACCELGNRETCEIYYQFRPSDDCLEYRGPVYTN
ncbi:Sushi domain-containing protein 2 [Holothuria leucospilota]|uniref:Sushi domain-containing protein 2 n=1 Tax=Holothuria leucospilota TaxID=206669 RepID=A0A9Q1C4R4_HOLLE|nr:Sushi domain-containing protein 2 [Holothuria leucospilota]KAJ8046299.1 Sushi domain-containing protein 2 [Holothuria leucospilota]